MDTWPTTITILKDNYKEGMADQTIRSNMGKGPDKIRLYTTSAPKPLSLDLMLREDEVPTIETFYYSNNALPFYFTHPRTKEQVVARFTSFSGFAWNEGFYRTSIGLEILP